MSKLDRLIRLARIVRRAYEKIYGQYSDLNGVCFDASRQLFLLAKDNGLAVEIGIGDGHAFVLLDNTVVDVTATQFGKRRKVLIAKRKQLEKQHWHHCRPWKLESRHDNIGSVNRSWGYRCDNQYKKDRQVVIQTLKEERR
jgi:hypothetical protein